MFPNLLNPGHLSKCRWQHETWGTCCQVISDACASTCVINLRNQVQLDPIYLCYRLCGQCYLVSFHSTSEH